MSLSPEEIRAAVRDSLRQIAPEADFDALPPDASIRQELDIDSFDFLRLLMSLHQRLGIDIPETDYGHVTTARGLLDYLTKHPRGQDPQ